MKNILLVFFISFSFFSCGDDPIYQKEVYTAKLKEIKLKESILDKRIAELDDLSQKNEKNWELLTVLKAQRNIKAGSKISSDMLESFSFPKIGFSKNMVNPSSKSFIIGQTVTRDINMGDIIFYEDILTKSSSNEIAQITPKRGRAVNLSFSKENPVSNLIRPNNHVDVIWTYTNKKTNKLVSKLLFQDIIVMAVGAYSIENIDLALKKHSNLIEFNDITLYLSAREALVLNLAKKSGSLSIIIRNNDSTETIKDSSISLPEIIKDSKLVNILNAERKINTKKITIIK